MIKKLLDRIEKLTECSKRELIGGLTDDIKSCDCLNCLVCKETIEQDIAIRRMIEEQLKATSDTSSDTLSETRKELDKCIITIEQKS